MQVERDGVTLEVEADPAGGTPLVMLMGLGAQLVMWPDGLCDRLRARGFRVVRMDNRDIGRSSHLAHLGVPNIRRAVLRSMFGMRVPSPYTIEDMADDVRAVLDALDLPRAHVMGASMGGMIAQAMAIRHPARVASLTSIMSTPGDRRYGWMAKSWAVRALMRPAGRTREEAIDRFVETFKIIGNRTHPIDEVFLRDAAARSIDRGMNPAGYARQLVAVLGQQSRRRALAALKVPSLVVHGAQDPLIPLAAGRATARAIPGARLLVLEDMAHDIPHPRWDTIADAVADLARQADAQAA